MRSKTRRQSSGVTLVEWAASVVFGLPLVVTMLYAVLEADYLFTIRTNIDAAARRACQLEINDWLQNNNAIPIPAPGNLPASYAFDIKTADNHYFVNRNANQFVVTWSPPITPIPGPPPTGGAPRTVTVTVIYPAGGSAAYSILPFPWPDPMGLGPSFQIWTTATFASPI